MHELATDHTLVTSRECIAIFLSGEGNRQRFLNEEMKQLIHSAKYLVSKDFKLPSNESNLFFNRSYLEEVRVILANYPESIPVIIGGHLSAKQHINLENFFNREIIDKFELVLEIFQSRAMTEESQLQIKLAQLMYQQPREKVRLLHQLGIEGAWHTERSGFWGTGETPLNVLEAIMTKNESRIREKLNKIKKQRDYKRSFRKRRYHESLYISLVGYTSAGKSTLLNTLIQQEASQVSSRLFETLDTKVRSFQLDDMKVFVTDTVGFIEDLPTFLIDSFRSTLEESVAADIVLLIIDASDPLPLVLQKAEITVQTISNLNLQNHQLIILNKIDLLDKYEVDLRVTALTEKFPELRTIPISALTNINPLFEVFNEFKPQIKYRCKYPPNSKFRAFFYNFTSITDEIFHNNYWQIEFYLRQPKIGLEVLKREASLLNIEINLEVI
ncbi:GTPase HflX [Candidatus Hodarchaeum mangrovi]